MQPWSAAQVYVNALADDDSGRVEAYGGNYARLAEVKAKYDPGNRFRRNHNIRPGRGDAEIALPAQREPHRQRAPRASRSGGREARLEESGEFVTFEKEFAE